MEDDTELPRNIMRRAKFTRLHPGRDLLTDTGTGMALHIYSLNSIFVQSHGLSLTTLGKTQRKAWPGLHVSRPGPDYMCIFLPQK